MNPSIVYWLKVAGVVLIGICVIVLLGANKITSSIVLTATAIIILLPIGARKWLTWCRVAFVLAAFAFVLWNISTTEYPPMYYHTGFKFFDQLLYIFDVFLETVFGARLSR